MTEKKKEERLQFFILWTGKEKEEDI